MQELSSAGPIEQEHPVILGHHPKPLSAILHDAVRVLQVGKHPFQLVCLGHVRIHPVYAVARGGYQYLPVFAFNDACHESRHPLSCAVYHGYIGESAVLISLQCVRHTYIYSSSPCLHDAVHAVVSQSS